MPREFKSHTQLHSLADETCKVPEREMWHLGIVENKAGNIYLYGSLVQREEHSFGMGEVAISIFARASIWGIRIMAIISDFQSDDVGSIPIYPSI